MRKQYRAGPLRACMCKPNKRGEAPMRKDRDRMEAKLADRAIRNATGRREP